jgi:hypothetical protein
MQVNHICGKCQAEFGALSELDYHRRSVQQDRVTVTTQQNGKMNSHGFNLVKRVFHRPDGFFYCNCSAKFIRTAGILNGRNCQSIIDQPVNGVDIKPVDVQLGINIGVAGGFYLNNPIDNTFKQRSQRDIKLGICLHNEL